MVYIYSGLCGDLWSLNDLFSETFLDDYKVREAKGEPQSPETVSAAPIAAQTRMDSFSTALEIAECTIDTRRKEV